MPSTDRAMLLIEARLLRLLGELPPGWPPTPISVTAVVHGQAAILTLRPVAESGDAKSKGRTSCERDVLDAIRVEMERLGRRVLGAEIRSAMRAAGSTWGASTVNRALADLVADGLVVNENDRHGYGLPDAASGKLEQS